MAYDYSEIFAQAQDWAKQAVSDGYLNPETAQSLLAIDQRSPEQLFASDVDASQTRPLIVAFMGGTGVGKSSLLNRLAGHSIAKVGVERPTSREVTLYQHRSLAINQLPTGLPLESIKISQHDDASKSNIVWIDMPDFDSVELRNKHLVLEWLPHIDVLLYVVSPERYRDNKAWQLLLAEGARHAWLFVMNQWDRGQTVQFEDFKRQLHAVGFAEPLMFRTSCSEPEGDEFQELLTQLMAINGQHGVEQLSQHIAGLRRQQLKQQLQKLHDEMLGQDFVTLEQQLESLWQKKVADLRAGLAWSIQQLSKNWAINPGQHSEAQWWDEWAQNRVEDMFDELTLQAEACNVPTKPLKTALQPLRIHAGKKIVNQAETLGRQALLNPGSGFRRFSIRLLDWAETLLPMTAMGIVGYQVFLGYYHSAADASAYLGMDFAVHSVLLIGLSWLIPFFIHKKIQPSLEKAAYQGLNKGLEQGLINLAAETTVILEQQQQIQIRLIHQAAELMARCRFSAVNKIDKQTTLGRALLED